jgi:hypothetical protein
MPMILKSAIKSNVKNANKMKKTATHAPGAVASHLDYPGFIRFHWDFQHSPVVRIESFLCCQKLTKADKSCQNQWFTTNPA